MKLPRASVIAALPFIVVLSGHAALAQRRWVDDEQVLSAARVRLSAGLGVVRFVPPNPLGATPALIGSGLNLEEAVGLGRHLELGVRFGLRFEDAGRGLRADESARVFDTETFGTGLSVTPNPELRLRWSIRRWAWGEAGLEDRVVLPIVPDPNVTEVLGAWTSLHLKRVGRVDAAVNGVMGWQSFAAGRVLEPAVGLPVKLWANITDALFAGVMTTVHYSFGTRYTDSHARWIVGLGLGYRVEECDVTQATYLPDAAGEAANRLGFGFAVSCRM